MAWNSCVLLVNVITDSVSGVSRPSEADQKTLEDYYKSIRDQIIKNVYTVSAAYAKLKDEDLKKFTRQRFLQFGAIRNILDNETFAIKKQKQDVKVKDVVPFDSHILIPENQKGSTKNMLSPSGFKRLII